MKENAMNCPEGHGKMVMKRIRRGITFRGIRLTVPTNQNVCRVCGKEAGTVDQAADTQMRFQKLIAKQSTC
jgi:hypothetical protein